MEHKEDEFYLDKIRNGDPASYASLVDRYKDMVYSIAVKILLNQEDAEDLAQECFLKAFQQLHSFKGKSKFSTWLYTIVYRASVTKLKEKKIQVTPIQNDTDEISDGGINQFEQLQSKQMQHYVQAAIQKLPPSEALVVGLHYIDEIPIKEIHEITGLSIPNIKILLFRGRKKLERKLKFLLDYELKATNKDEN